MNQSVVLMPVDFPPSWSEGPWLQKQVSMCQRPSLLHFSPKNEQKPEMQETQSNCSYLFFKTRLDCIWILCSFFFSFSWKDWLLKDIGEFLGGYYIFSLTWLPLFAKTISNLSFAFPALCSLVSSPCSFSFKLPAVLLKSIPRSMKCWFCICSFLPVHSKSDFC